VRRTKQWAEADLAHGQFEKMVRDVDPFYGIYADAGAERKKYRVTRHCGYEGDELIVEAFNKLHANAIAWDEEQWPASETRAALIEDRV
jgi:hypothetical protein